MNLFISSVNNLFLCECTFTFPSVCELFLCVSIFFYLRSFPCVYLRFILLPRSNVLRIGISDAPQRAPDRSSAAQSLLVLKQHLYFSEALHCLLRFPDGEYIAQIVKQTHRSNGSVFYSDSVNNTGNGDVGVS